VEKTRASILTLALRKIPRALRLTGALLLAMASGAQWWVAMPIPGIRHLDEEAAEKYSLGQLSSKRTAEIENHLLLCDLCRKAVVDADEYIAAMRHAAAKTRKEENRKDERKPRRRVAGK
jgi:hypothetical protein